MVQLIRSVAAGADDGHIDGITFFGSSTSVYAGKAGSASQNPWFRFDNITVPKNAIITSAYLRLWFESHPSDDPPGDNAAGNIFAEDADDPDPFDSYSGGSVPWTGRTATTAGVSWPLLLSWTDGASQDSPDVKTVIQELVTRAGWVSGQAMVLWWEDAGTGGSDEWQFVSFDGSGTAPILEINYTEDIELEADIAASGAVESLLFIDPIFLAADVLASSEVAVDVAIVPRFFDFPGTTGNYLSTEDRNILDGASAHMVQGVGLWTVGSVSTNQQLFGPSSLLVSSGASTAITPATDDAFFSVAVYSAAGDTFNINGGTGVVVPAATWTRLTAAGSAGTYTVNAAGSGDYYLDEACLQDTDYTFVPSVRLVGDIDLRADVAMADWTPPWIMAFMSRRVSGGGQHLNWRGNTDGTQLLWWSEDGAGFKTAASTVGNTKTDWERGTVRVTLDVSGRTSKFYVDGVQLGTDVTGAATSLWGGDAGPLEVGARHAGTDLLYTGKMYRLQVRDGIDGPIVADVYPFNVPGDPRYLPNGYTWTDLTGRTWTVNGVGLVLNEDENNLSSDVAAESTVGGPRDRFGGWRSEGPFLVGPQQDTKLVHLFDDVQLRVDFAPDTVSPLQHPVWESMSTDLISARWSHGRSGARDQGSPGQLEIVLNNTDGWWDQTSVYNGWAASAKGGLLINPETGQWYWPNKGTPTAFDTERFRVGKQIRVQAVYAGTTYDMWRGVIDSINMRFPTGPGVQQVETIVTAQDHLQFLSLAETNSTFAREGPQERIKTLLDEAAWIDDPTWRHATTSDRDKGLTNTTKDTRAMAPFEADQNSVLDLIQQTAISDGGAFLVNTAGQATYHGKQVSTGIGGTETYYRQAQIYDAAAYPPSRFEVSVAGTTVAGYTEAEWGKDDQSIWNSATVTPGSTRNSTGTLLNPVTFNTTAYQDLYGVRAVQISDVQNDSQTGIGALSANISGKFLIPNHNSVFRATIGRTNTHWLPDYLTLQQDDYVQVDQMYAAGGLGARWWNPVNRAGYVNQFRHEVDIRTQTWRIDVNIGDRSFP